MKIPRAWNVYYGVVVIGISRRIKSIVRELGEWMKVYGRTLVAWGEDSIPRWSRELFCKCYFVETEVHYSGEVYVGKIEAIYQKFAGKESILVIKLVSMDEGQSRSSRDETRERLEFEMTGYGSPVIIKEDGYDCVWFSFDKGYVAMYFSRPIKSDE